MKNTIQILSGPSREELFDGLRLFFEKREIPFFLQCTSEVPSIFQLTSPFIIQSIEAEDGSGNSWNIRMVLKLESLRGNFRYTPSFLKRAFAGTPVKQVIIVKAHYSTKSREGVITIE